MKSPDRKRPRYSTRSTSPKARGHLQLLSFTHGEARVPVNDTNDIMAARQMGTQFATRLGFSPSEITLIAAIISELARIIIVGAEAGHLTFTVLENGARRGLEVVAQQGAAPPSTSNISGRQLADVGKLMDEFTIVSEQGNGTTVTLKKWLVNGR